LSIADLLAVLDAAVYDPTKESVEDFTSRIDRYVLALAALDAPIDPMDVKILKAKAMIVGQLYDESGGHLPAGDAVRRLTAMFVENAQSTAPAVGIDIWTWRP
jgi:hypothetical protein